MSEDAGGAVDSVKEAFQGKRGKILIVGGGIAIAAYVWWTRRNGTPEPAAPTDPTVADGPSGRTPQTDPEVGNTSTGSTSTGPRKYANDADWLADGTSFLQGRGTPSAAGYDALTKALGGLPLTTQQIGWVSQTISALGPPPGGMPPLNASAPPGTTPPAPKYTLPSAPAAGSGRGYGWHKVVRGDSATSISKKYGIPLAEYYAFNGLARLVIGKYVKVRGASNPVIGPYYGK